MNDDEPTVEDRFLDAIWAKTPSVFKYLAIAVVVVLAAGIIPRHP
jgi:hypothetical protein